MTEIKPCKHISKQCLDYQYLWCMDCGALQAMNSDTWQLPSRPSVKEGQAGSNKCCDNGDFNDEHICQKQKPTPPASAEWPEPKWPEEFITAEDLNGGKPDYEDKFLSHETNMERRCRNEAIKECKAAFATFKSVLQSQQRLKELDEEAVEKFLAGIAKKFKDSPCLIEDYPSHTAAKQLCQTFGTKPQSLPSKNQIDTALTKAWEEARIDGVTNLPLCDYVLKYQMEAILQLMKETNQPKGESHE